jgi:tetratricopeptide (TPR) repeat protein
VDGYRFTERHARALELLQGKALPLLDAIAERHPRHPELQYDLHVTHDYIGEMNLALGDLESAVPAYEEALRVAQVMVQADSLNQKAFEALARSYVSLSVAFERSGDLDDAVEALEEGSRIHARLYERSPRNAEMANILGNTNRRLCRVLREDLRPAEALPWCLASERALEAAVAASAENAVVQSNLGSAYVLTARVYRALADGAEEAEAGRNRALARSRYAEALKFLRPSEGEGDAPEFLPDSVAAELASLQPGG